MEDKLVDAAAPAAACDGTWDESGGGGGCDGLGAVTIGFICDDDDDGGGCLVCNVLLLPTAPVAPSSVS